MRKECIICKKHFRIRVKVDENDLHSSKEWKLPKRQHKAQTCSHECSRKLSLIGKNKRNNKRRQIEEGIERWKKN